VGGDGTVRDFPNTQQQAEEEALLWSLAQMRNLEIDQRENGVRQLFYRSATHGRDASPRPCLKPTSLWKEYSYGIFLRTFWSGNHSTIMKWMAQRAPPQAQSAADRQF
jgi:hypothetical protein